MEKTRVDRLIERAKNHRLLSIVVLLFLIFVALGKFTDALDKVFTFGTKYFKPEEAQIKELAQNVPKLGFRITDSLYDEKEKAKSGEIVYEGLITLPFSEETGLSDLMLKVRFPMAIKSCTIVDQRGVDGPKIRTGPVALSKRGLAEEQVASTFQLDIEVVRMKPGAFFRFLVTTEFLEDRRISSPIRYEGYYYWSQKERRHKKTLSGSFSPQTEKAEPLTLDQWNKIGKTLDSLDDSGGSFLFWTSNRYWYVHNNLFIELLPRLGTRDIGLHVFRDKDNILKCKLRTPSHGDVTLAYGDFDIERLLTFDKHPNHIMVVIWNAFKAEFYVDGKLVAQHQSHKDMTEQ